MLSPMLLLNENAVPIRDHMPVCFATCSESVDQHEHCGLLSGVHHTFEFFIPGVWFLKSIRHDGHGLKKTKKITALDRIVHIFR